MVQITLNAVPGLEKPELSGFLLLVPPSVALQEGTPCNNASETHLLDSTVWQGMRLRHEGTDGQFPVGGLPGRLQMPHAQGKKRATTTRRKARETTPTPDPAPASSPAPPPALPAVALCSRKAAQPSHLGFEALCGSSESPETRM
ncbi:hypothetical protein B0H13DRAFT_1855124 [Mycena leptocephala]|nr:hypothetical protein B0H13DRAFT_1855124 [Mycena leptocephala]